MSTSWPKPVWEALNRLAELDLANYRTHVFDREAFLGTARAKRADQHRTLIDRTLADDPQTTCDTLLEILNPPPAVKPDPLARTAAAQARLYELNDRQREPLPPPLTDCAACNNQGVIAGVTCGCQRGMFVAFVRTLTHPLTKGA